MEITRGRQAAPLRAVVYGPEGVGKTTFAAAWPGAVFIDIEDGSAHYDVARLPRPGAWDELIATVKAAAGIAEVGTLVIDTADAAEELCVRHVLKKYNKTGIEDFGYGKGHTYASEEFGRLLGALDEVKAAGKNVLVVAHSQIRKFEQPDELGAYDRWELKLSKKDAPMLKEWSDLLLFVNFKTDIMTNEKTKKAKATGGKRRVMYASHSASWDAKNRLGLPDEMPFDFAQVASVVPGGAGATQSSSPAPQPAAKPEPKAESKPEPKGANDEADEGAVEVIDAKALKDGALADADREHAAMLLTLQELMTADGVTEAQLRRAVASRQSNPYTEQTAIASYATEFVRDVLCAHWDAIKATVAELKAADAKPGAGVYDKDIPF